MTKKVTKRAKPTLTWRQVKECPLCGTSNDHKLRIEPIPYLNTHFFNVVVFYGQCSYCGFIFQNPQPLPEQVAEIYANHYRRLVKEAEVPDEKAVTRESARAKQVFDIMEETIGVLDGTGKFAMDVGSSCGAMLGGFKLWDYVPWGVEPYTNYREACKQQLKVDVVPHIDDLPRAKFNLISMIHTLEHLQDPVDVLTKLRHRHAEPDTWLYIEVPNAIGHKTPQGFFHPCVFTKRTLITALGFAGWSVKHVRFLNGYNETPFRFPWNIHVLAKPGKFRTSFYKDQFSLLRRDVALYLNQRQYVKYVEKAYLENLMKVQEEVSNDENDSTKSPEGGGEVVPEVPAATVQANN